jgi:Mg2+-importing ATPase
MFAFLWFYLKANIVESISIFQTGWFIESLLSQTLVVHIIRTGKIPFIQSSASHSLIFATVFICAIGIALPYSMMASSFHLSKPPLEYWISLSLLIPSYLFITQLAKAHFIKRWGLI